MIPTLFPTLEADMPDLTQPVAKMDKPFCVGFCILEAAKLQVSWLIN